MKRLAAACPSLNLRKTISHHCSRPSLHYSTPNTSVGLVRWWCRLRYQTHFPWPFSSNLKVLPYICMHTHAHTPNMYWLHYVADNLAWFPTLSFNCGDGVTHGDPQVLLCWVQVYKPTWLTDTIQFYPVTCNIEAEGAPGIGSSSLCGLHQLLLWASMAAFIPLCISLG